GPWPDRGRGPLSAPEAEFTSRNLHPERIVRQCPFQEIRSRQGAAWPTPIPVCEDAVVRRPDERTRPQVASPLFELSADMRTTAEKRRRSRRPHLRSAREAVPMPDPALTTQPPDPWQDSAPLLTVMDEVGAGLLDSLDAMQRVAAS